MTEKLRNYVYRYGTELSDDKLKKMGTSLEEINDIMCTIYKKGIVSLYAPVIHARSIL